MDPDEIYDNWREQYEYGLATEEDLYYAMHANGI